MGQDFVSIFAVLGGSYLLWETPLVCEASALTTELTAQNRIYFTPKNQLCKLGALASSSLCSDMGHLLRGYQLCATSEGKSPNAIAIVTNSVSYFQDFLASQGISTDVTQISEREIRAFILYLQQKRCFSGHRFNHTRDRGLSGHTINCYLRSLRGGLVLTLVREFARKLPFESAL